MQCNTHTFVLQIVSLVSALVLCFALSVPALADEVLSGTAGFQTARSAGSYWSNDGTQDISSGASNLSFRIGSGTSMSPHAWRSLSLSSQLVPSDSQAGIYFSCFYYGSGAANQNHAPTKNDFYLRYLDVSSGAYKNVPVNSVSLFAPSATYNSMSDGVSISARFSNSLSQPLSGVILYNQTSAGVPSWTFDSAQYEAIYVRITSFRVVSTSSSAELDALEDMASEIANQSQILSQFYGDIVAICNQIYERLGDIQAAQEEANALFSNVISLLDTTNDKLEAINMAMSTYFELLINQLKQEGVDTRTAIADAEARLEAYLKPMIDYFNELEEQTGESAATLPQHKTDIDGFDNQGYGIDSDGQAGVAVLVPVLTSFSWIFQIIAIFIGVGVINLLVKKGLS